MSSLFRSYPRQEVLRPGPIAVSMVQRTELDVCASRFGAFVVVYT